MLRIAFMGKQFSGKDEAAQALVAQFTGTILKFADPLYETESHFWKALNLPIPKNKSLRRPVLLHLGKAGREIDPYLYADDLERRMKTFGVGSNIFVSDLRFPKEAEILRKNNFKIIKIIVDDRIRYSRGADSRFNDDASETLLDHIEVDHVLPNHYATALDWRNCVVDFVNSHKDEFYLEPNVSWKGTLFEDVGM